MRRQTALRTLVVVSKVLLLVYCINTKRTAAFSANQYQKPKEIPFKDFEFAKNNVCISPQYFVAVREDRRNVSSTEDDNEPSYSYFTMRNVPGDGDCMFLAVALAAATSMGLGGSNQLLRTISRETREVVAQVLSAPSGKLFIGPGRDNVVDASKLLRSAVAQEPNINTVKEYLEALRKEGRCGGLYGGGPELVALSNVLRRPISIYEVDEERLEEQKHQEQLNGGCDEIKDNNDNKSSLKNFFPIVCKGSFGEGVFEDPCLTSIPDSVILSNMQPGAYSWRLHILVVNSSPSEKHACVLLPQRIHK